jgi:glycosyltransferase involved in cell wall biosynthesis
MTPKTICYFVGTHADWGGASRVLFHVIRNVDKNRFRPIVMLTQEGSATRELEKLGISCQIWPTHDLVEGRFRYALGLIRSARFFRKQKVDIIHLNYACIGWRPAELVAARLLGIPVIDHVHIAPDVPYPALKDAKAIVAVSKFVADHTKGGSVPVEVIYNAVDMSRFCGTPIRSKLGIPESAVIVSLHGQMRRIKGVEMFVELARRIPDENVRFLMTGPLRPGQEGAYTLDELKDLIRFDKRISYLGYVDNVQDIYATTDIVVMPSQWEETFGLILIEAGANRKPAVATRVGGIPEVIIDNETGFLVDQHDIDSMTRCVKLLIKDPALREKMGNRAREVIEEQFTTKPMIEIEAVYDRLNRQDGDHAGIRRART